MELIINEPGYSFQLPKTGLIRTPCKLNISSIDINLIISTLRMNGITKYQFIEDNNSKIQSIPKNIKVVKANKEDKIIIKTIENKTDVIELKKLNKKFEKLEEFIDAFQKSIKDNNKQNKPNNQRRFETKKPIVENLKDDDFDEFIPEIRIDGMEISSKKNEEVESFYDISNSADILRELKGGSNE